MPVVLAISHAHSPQLSAGGEMDVDALLHEASRGSSVLLSALPSAGALTIGGLAARALEHRLRAGAAGQGDVVKLKGGTFPPAAAGRSADVFGCHERGWIAAGDLWEELLARFSGEAVTHVFCLDPWAACLRGSARDFLSRAKWVYVSDLEARRHGHEADYWASFEGWISQRPFDHVIQARSLLQFVPEDTWTPAPHGGLRAALRGHRVDGSVVLIDEAADAPFAPQVLHAAHRKWDGASQIVLITPHLRRHAESDAAKSCIMALESEDLAVPVYAALLQCADVYIAPSRLPYGTGALGYLAEKAEVFVPQRAAESLQVSRGTHLRSHDGPDSLAHVLAMGAPGPPVRSPAVRDDAANEDSYHGWWRQLSALVRKPEPGEESSDLAILTCCYKYLQRFRVFLDSVARQSHPVERIEICVAAPGNPDGLLEYLDLFREAHPKLSIRVADVPGSDRANRGKMVNAAFRISSAPVVMVADCDIVLPRDFVETMLAAHDPGHVVGCWRTPLPDDATAQIVTGNLDPLDVFEGLRERWDPKEAEGVREGVLGYCQIVSRQAFGEVMYPEEFDRINQSDIVFVERLGEKLGITPYFLRDQFVLHLSHPRDWSGTKVFL